MKFKEHKIEHNILPIYLIKNHLHKGLDPDFKIGDWNINLNMIGGWGNGYVGIPIWHPFYKKDYDELNEYIQIHGGLTFSDYDDEENLWIIGFDTNHPMDDMKRWPYDKVLEETKYLRNECLKLKEVQRILKLNKIEKILYK